MRQRFAYDEAFMLSAICQRAVECQPPIFRPNLRCPHRYPFQAPFFANALAASSSHRDQSQAARAHSFSHIAISWFINASRTSPEPPPLPEFHWHKASAIDRRPHPRRSRAGQSARTRWHTPSTLSPIQRRRRSWRSNPRAITQQQKTTTIAIPIKPYSTDAWQFPNSLPHCTAAGGLRLANGPRQVKERFCGLAGWRPALGFATFHPGPLTPFLALLAGLFLLKHKHRVTIMVRGKGGHGEPKRKARSAQGFAGYSPRAPGRDAASSKWMLVSVSR